GPTRDTSRVGTGRESGTLGDPRAPHVAAGESRRDRRGTARPADASVAMPVQHTEGWRLHRCGGIRRSSDARRARTPHAALASPAAARQSRVVLSLHARVWLRPGRVAPGSRPPGAPTDPDVRDSRI